MGAFIIVIAVLIILILFLRDVVYQDRTTTYQNTIDMSKKSWCPFCWQKIPKITETKTIVKQRRHGVKVKKITVVIGEDWATHVRTCTKLKEFLNKTKDEEIKETIS